VSHCEMTVSLDDSKDDFPSQYSNTDGSGSRILELEDDWEPLLKVIFRLEDVLCMVFLSTNSCDNKEYTYIFV